jgi:hypothetical protein
MNRNEARHHSSGCSCKRCRTLFGPDMKIEVVDAIKQTEETRDILREDLRELVARNNQSETDAVWDTVRGIEKLERLLAALGDGPRGLPKRGSGVPLRGGRA